MAVWREKNGRTYRYSFQFRGLSYKGNTGQITEADAREWERKERVRVARVAGGLEADTVTAAPSPLMQEWADVYFAWARSNPGIKRPDLIENNLRMILEFFGVAPPGVAPTAEAPYHGLTLADPIDDPEWVVRFEQWMRTRRRRLSPRREDPPDTPRRLGGFISGSQRNSFRAAASGLYRVALLPEYRKVARVKENPFLNVPRDRRRRRRLKLQLADLRAWVQHAAWHVKIALCIGALAPTLRRNSILALRWPPADATAAATVAADWSELRVDEHKTDEDGEPVVVPVVGQLREVLEHAWAHRTDRVKRREVYSGYVVHYRGRRVKSLKTALRRAAQRAGIPYGTHQGSTFHTLRHFMSTLLAKKGVAEALRAGALDHTIETAQGYTHLAATELVAPLSVISDATPLVDLLHGAKPGDGPRRGKNRGTENTTETKNRGNLAVFTPRAKGA